jgi:hypothetical protein
MTLATEKIRPATQKPARASHAIVASEGRNVEREGGKERRTKARGRETDNLASEPEGESEMPGRLGRATWHKQT